MSQKRPRSFSSTVEWPRRNSVRSGAASNWSFVSACTSIGRSGTVPAGLWNMTSQKIPSIFQKPCSGSTAGLRNRPSAHWGDCSREGWPPSGAGVDGPFEGTGVGEDITREAVMARAPTIRTATTPLSAMSDSGSSERRAVVRLI